MRIFMVLLGLVAVIWTFVMIDVISLLTYWVPVIGVPLVCAILYNRWFKTTRMTRGRRKFFPAAFDKYWWIWLPAVMLATAITILIVFRGRMGISVPYLGWGLRGTPWGFVYFFQLMMWTGVMLTIGCLSIRFRSFLMRCINLWREHGGLRIWSKDNWPANTLLAVYVVVVYLAVLQGVPLPDTDLAKYEAEMSAYQALQSDFGQTVSEYRVRAMKVVLNKEISTAVESPVHPGPRFERSWFWIKWVFLFTPLALFAFIASRRDGVYEFGTNTLGLLRKAEETVSGEAKSKGQKSSQKKGADDQDTKDGDGGTTSFGTEVVKEVGAQEMTKLMYAGIRRGKDLLMSLGMKKARG